MGDFSKSDVYASLSRFSHLSRVFRAGAHFSALDGQQLHGCLRCDIEGGSNTGAQTSKATPSGVARKSASGGKTRSSGRGRSELELKDRVYMLMISAICVAQDGRQR